mmetsp:Transcript_34832/g.58172  ORF Transcript_34832/g.58172 Transcript_34832/m.58172 type:complete len:223 (+) Transcript_34832:1707-2375(+)
MRFCSRPDATSMSCFAATNPDPKSPFSTKKSCSFSVVQSRSQRPLMSGEADVAGVGFRGFSSSTMASTSASSALVMAAPQRRGATFFRRSRLSCCAFDFAVNGAKKSWKSFWSFSIGLAATSPVTAVIAMASSFNAKGWYGSMRFTSVGRPLALHSAAKASMVPPSLRIAESTPLESISPFSKGTNSRGRNCRAASTASRTPFTSGYGPIDWDTTGIMSTSA